LGFYVRRPLDQLHHELSPGPSAECPIFIEPFKRAARWFVPDALPARDVLPVGVYNRAWRSFDQVLQVGDVFGDGPARLKVRIIAQFHHSGCRGFRYLRSSTGNSRNRQSADPHRCHRRSYSGSGKSAVGLAAYITGEYIYDEENKRTCYRGHPGEVKGWGTLAPAAGPSYLTNKDQLGKAWNDAQRAETRSNSHLANHWVIGLWRNATPGQHQAVMEKIAKQASERYRVMVTWAVHEPSGEGSDDNWHGHLAMNMRRVTPEGFGAKAREIVDGKTRRLETEWMRRMIADEINGLLRSVNSDERITHESYQARGILKQPMQHMGNNAWQAEKRGEPTRIGDRNRKIRNENAAFDKEVGRSNATIDKIDTKLSKLAMQIIDLTNIESPGMEQTDAQSQQREDVIARDYGKIDYATEAVANHWMDHVRQIRETEERDRQKEKDGRAVREDDGVQDEKARWAQACGRYSDMRDPYGSLATAARAEGAMFRERQEDLRQREAVATNPEDSQVLKLTRYAEASAYMAFTSERLAGISRVISGHRDSESEVYYRAEAEKYREIEKSERQQLGKLRDVIDDRNIEALHQEIERLERQAREDPFGRRMAAQRQVETREESFGVAQTLPENAPNRDRPQKDQRPAANHEPFDAAAWREQDAAEYASRADILSGAAARENPFDAMARQEGERSRRAPGCRP
jgi:MobA/MobL family